jgi:hypothetical protein
MVFDLNYLLCCSAQRALVTGLIKADVLLLKHWYNVTSTERSLESIALEHLLRFQAYTLDVAATRSVRTDGCKPGSVLFLQDSSLMVRHLPSSRTWTPTVGCFLSVRASSLRESTSRTSSHRSSFASLHINC